MWSFVSPYGASGTASFERCSHCYQEKLSWLQFCPRCNRQVHGLGFVHQKRIDECDFLFKEAKDGFRDPIGEDEDDKPI